MRQKEVDELKRVKMRPYSEWVGEGRQPINYRLIDKFLASRIGQEYDKTYSDIIKKFPAKKHHLLKDYLKCCVNNHKWWSDYFVDEQGKL